MNDDTQPRKYRKKPRKYRKKPVVIEAIHYTGDIGQLSDLQDAGWVDVVSTDATGLIRTLEGDMTVVPGDWIICGVQGERYPCKPDIFEATYEVASP